MNEQPGTLRSPWIFFLIAVGFSWLFWIPAVFVDGSIFGSPWSFLLYVGGLGPAVGGVLLTLLDRDRQRRREYGHRLVDLRRIGIRWLLVILFAFPLLTALLALIENGQVRFTDSFEQLLLQPLSFIPFVLYIFIFGPLPEELGWRGFALDPLQGRLNAVAASLLLGTIWAAWHIPLFFIKGTYQNGLGFGTPAFWLFMAFAVVISFFFTWICNNTRGSTLSAVLFHFSVNFTGNVFEVPEALELHRLILLALLAMIVIAVYGARDLVRKPKIPVA
jgi:membrane protease YdiL (CAAX protease family)